MRNIIVLLVICALFSFALAFPQDKGGLGQFIKLANGTCDSIFECAGEGDSCVTTCNYTDSDNVNCCASGLLCKNETCMSDNLDGWCNAASDCFYPGYATRCVDHACALVYYPGDSCSVDTDCITACDNETSTCIGFNETQTCVTGQCAYGLTCGFVNGAQSCVKLSGPNETCTSDHSCWPGYGCNGQVCVEAFSLEADAACGNSETVCETDLVCYNGKCVEGEEWEIQDCDDNSDCPNGETCLCSQITGEQFCSTPVDKNNFTNYHEEMNDLYSCVREYNCTNVGNGPNSCVQQNCGSDADALTGASCDLGDTVYGSCYYNDACGGFPLWAIIVIIVVAVVLVLVVVVVVVMAMRKRRQYDTIA